MLTSRVSVEMCVLVTWRGSWLPRVSDPREPGRSYRAFYVLALEATRPFITSCQSCIQVCPVDDHRKGRKGRNARRGKTDWKLC